MFEKGTKGKFQMASNGEQSCREMQLKRFQNSATDLNANNYLQSFPLKVHHRSQKK